MLGRALISIPSADMSDLRGIEDKGQVIDNLAKYKPLSGDELGCFNNGIKMPIPCKDHVDLRQPPYPMSWKAI